MFTGFNLKINDNEKKNLINQYLDKGKILFNKTKKNIAHTLKEYIGLDGVIDCTKLQEDWFPEVNDHIFLSHSHDDKDLAISLATYLKEEYGLKVFIDSCVWNYCDDLLKELDDEYCYNDDKKTYDYTNRNYTTTHVHLMLSTALNKMINKTECIMFLNTDNSILKTEDILSTKTTSPWIYSEITTTIFIKKNTPDRLKNLTFNKKKILNEASEDLKTKYDLNLKHLFPLKYNDLKNLSKENSPECVLNNLYISKNIIS